MRKVFTTVAVALVATAFLAACGGDDDDSSADAESLPKEEFVERADAECKESAEALDAEVEAVFEAHPELAEVASVEDIPDDVIDEVINTGISNYEDLLPELRKIAPEGEEEAWSDVLDDVEAALDEIEDDPRQFFDPGAEDPFEEARTGAEELGLTECGS